MTYRIKNRWGATSGCDRKHRNSLPLRGGLGWSLFLLIFLFTACSQADSIDVDEPDKPNVPAGTEVPVRITLSALPINGQTRADGDPKDPNASVELIHDWWLAIINQDTKEFIKILTRDDVETISTSTSVTGLEGYEAETFRTILPKGKYRIYAFANIPYEKKDIFVNPGNYTYDKKGQQVNKYKDGTLSNTYINDFVTDAFSGNTQESNNGMQWRSDVNIPMTQILKDIYVSNTVEESFNIEVVRAVAKVEFAFSNPSTDEITLKQLEFDPISKGEKISIVPNYSAIGKGPNNKLYEDVNDNNTKDNPTLGELSFNNIELTRDASGKYNMGTFSFYCKESIPQKDGGPFDIELKITKNGKEETKTLQTKKITYINRNDWIHIPITFTDWIFRWRMHYYPPIGGYPPLFEQTNDGTTVNLVATTPGEFEIFPDITFTGNDGQRTDYDWVQDGKDTWNHEPNDQDPVKYVDIKVTNGSELFAKAPTKQTVTASIGEKDRYYFAGEFNNNVGTATVVVTFRLASGPYANEEKTCTFNITRKNSKN